MTTESTTAEPIVTTGEQPVVTSPVVLVEQPTTETPAPETPAPETPAPVQPDPAKTTPEWAQKRINELTAKRHEQERIAAQERDARLAAEARAAELLQQLAARPAEPTQSLAAPKAQPPVTNLSEEEIERRAQQKAAAMAHAARFNEACNNIVDTGKKEFKDWDDAVKNLTMVGAIGPNVGTEFLETAIELKHPHKILHYLGGNLEEASKIAALPPTKMAVEMARIEAQLNAPTPVVVPPVSQAPAPVIPVNGAPKAGNASIDDPTLSTDEWLKLRAQQVEERKNRYRR